MHTRDAITIFNAGVEAVKPAKLLHQHLALNGEHITIAGKTFYAKNLKGVYLLAIGKAAAAMAAEAEQILGEHIAGGLVVTKYNHALPLQYCKTIEAGHPVPDDNSVLAAREVMAFARHVPPGSILLCCISGGASALLADVPGGIGLEDMRQLSALLLQCGADIHEINAVRKQVSTLKGGRLLTHIDIDVDVMTFIISDVLGDDISVIASGLTVPGNAKFIDAWKVLQKYDLYDDCPLPVTRYLIDGMKGIVYNPVPKPGDAILNRLHNKVIATNSTALQAAAEKATQLGYKTHVINSGLHGEAEAQAIAFVQHLQQYKGDKPACILMGGETTVTVRGSGKGGRNQHFVLACVNELLEQGILPGKVPVILSGGTDGTDGPTGAAGAFVDEALLLAIKRQGLQPAAYLSNNDSYHFFQQLNALLVTGPTQTNVMDIVVGITV